MVPELMLTPEDVDLLCQWPAGKARKMANKKKIPHYRLPDGEPRFLREHLVGLFTFVPRAEEVANAK
jgi:hypothetical protein